VQYLWLRWQSLHLQGVRTDESLPALAAAAVYIPFPHPQDVATEIGAQPPPIVGIRMVKRAKQSAPTPVLIH
jgi:hypothetical protein